MSTVKERMAASTFVFLRHDQIGAAAAEDDAQFLSECFVDTGDLARLIDCKDPKRVILGRTGSGKSALISELGKAHPNVVPLSPHSLSLNFIANNQLIAFFEATGVNLAVFYGLLWKHILVVELLRKKFNIKGEESQRNYMYHVRSLYKKDRIKEIAIDYFEKWGDKFWQTTEERIHEITERIEKNLSGAIEGSFGSVDISVEGAKALSTERRKEIIERGQKAVSDVQVRELENMISILADDIFNDPQENYYVTIDMLDEEWADDRIKYKLIRSLIDTIRRFRKVNNVKIIVALRVDLLDKVLNFDPEPGFQEEKYESLYLDLKWTRKQLVDLVERRLALLVKRRYTSAPVTCKDIFPSRINESDPLDYILDRTFLRPRDAILFVNECINHAIENRALTASIIKKAEGEYSQKRLQSLATEWITIYPNLKQVLQVFFGMKDHFPVSDLTEDLLMDKYLEIAESVKDCSKDPILNLLNRAFSNSDANFASARNAMLRHLQITGFLGIKTSPSSSVTWSTTSRTTLSSGQVKPSSTLCIHPTFHRALDIVAPTKH